MNVAKIIEKAKDRNDAKDLFSERKTLVQMLRDVFGGRYKMSLSTRLALVLGIAYIIFPLDFDWIPILGWIDDGFVGFWVVKRLLHETRRYAMMNRSEGRIFKSDSEG